MISTRCGLLCGSIQRQASWPNRLPIFDVEASITAPVDTVPTVEAEPVSSIRSAPGSPEYTNFEVDKLLRRAAGHPLPDIPKDTAGGSVYVLVAKHNGIPIIKIGHTAKDAKHREQTHRRTCTGLDFQPTSTTCPAGRYYKHVEKLAHAELKDLGYSFDCACGTQHREYFTVDLDTACHIVNRWIRFCEQKPWRFFPARGAKAGCPGELKEEWLVRLNGFQKQVAAHTFRTAAEALGNRLELWDGFVGAGVWNWVWDDAWRAWGALQLYWKWMGIVGILMCGAVSHPWLGLDWLEWASMAILLVVLACTVGALMWDSSKRGSSEPFLQQAQWIVLVGLLVGSVVLFLALGQGWLRVARVLMWFLVVVLLSMIRTLLQLRCVTMEHWLRPRSKIPSL